MANFYRKQPVEELVASGFGTLTHQSESVTTGKGTWNQGQWTVVIKRPLTTDDPLDYQFPYNPNRIMWLAVWDGSGENVGARKHYSNEIAFSILP